MHAGLELGDAGGGMLPGVGGIGAVAEVGIGHGGDLALHLIEHQQAVREHPAAIGGGAGAGRVDRHTRLDPVDQLVAPEAEQLAEGGQPGHRGRAQGGQALTQKLEGVARQLIVPSVAPVTLGPPAPAGEDPERVACHEAPAAEALAPLHRLEQHAMAAMGTRLEPGGQGRFQVGRPALPEGREVGTLGASHRACGDLLKEGGTVRAACGGRH